MSDQTPTLGDRLSMATDSVRDSREQIDDQDGSLKSLKAVLLEIKNKTVDERNALSSEIAVAEDVLTYFDVQNEHAQEARELISVIRGDLEGLRGDVESNRDGAEEQVPESDDQTVQDEEVQGEEGKDSPEQSRQPAQEYFVPEVPPEEAAQDKEEKTTVLSYFTGPLAGIKKQLAPILSFFGIDTDEKSTSSVGSSAMLRVSVFAAGFFPFLDWIPGMKENKAKMEKLISHIESTKKIESIVAAENKNRSLGNKIAIDLADFVLFEANLQPEQYEDIPALAAAAIRDREPNDRKPLRWEAIAAATIKKKAAKKEDVAQAEQKPKPDAAETSPETA